MNWDKLQSKSGVLYRVSRNRVTWKNTFQYVFPSALEETVFRGIHDEAGHQGQRQTLSV